MKTSTILNGQVKIPCHSCGSVTTVNVKQRKGYGTYDAIKLSGKLPKKQHLAIIIVMMGNKTTPLTAEQIRYKVNKNRKYPVLQSHFQRYHSELLFWKIIKKTDEKINPPTYLLNHSKSDQLLEGGKFC